MSELKNILITGATGQVGGQIAADFAAYPDFRGSILAPVRAELDLASPESIRAFLQAARPRWIINPAAYTAVDKAESESDLAYAINAEAPRILGEEARKIGAVVLHFSTDYVFDGTKPTPYIESDQTNPLGVYGASKLAGEQALPATGAPHMILRTSWVYGATGKNFLLTILKLARERSELKIVADQHGAPTWSHDLALLAAHIVHQCESESASLGIPLGSVVERVAGTYHAGSQGETTWHGFASEGVRLQQLAEPDVKFANLIPIASSEYPTPARRPMNSRLNCDKLQQAFGFRIPPWQTSLARVVASIQ